MKLANVEKEILAALMKNPKSVMVLENPAVDCVGLSLGGVAYIIPAAQLWLDTTRLERRVDFRSVCSVLDTSENVLTMTGSLEECDGLVLRRFEDFTGEPVWVVNDLLKHFTAPEFFQATPKGPILVMETDNKEGPHKVGVLSPYNRKDQF